MDKFTFITTLVGQLVWPFTLLAIVSVLSRGALVRVIKSWTRSKIKPSQGGSVALDFTKIAPEFRKEIVREGTVYLDGQLKIATAADARASGLAGIFTAAATALTAGVVIAIFNSTTNGQAGTAVSSLVAARLPMMIGGGIAALLFISAAVLCVAAIRPVSFWLPGLAPENWSEDVESGRELDDCLGERAGHIQEQIAANLITIGRNAGFFKWGAIVGISAPFAGAMAWLISFYW